MPFDRLKRREFISLLGGAAAACPLAVRAQEGERVRRIGILMVIAADDPEVTRRVAAFQQALQELGWTNGGNLRLDYRWGPNLPERVSPRRGRIARATRQTSSWRRAARRARPFSS